MKRSFLIYKIFAVISLLLLVLFLIFKVKIFSFDLSGYGDKIKVYKDLLTIGVIILGGIASYFRFFAGQTLSKKGEIDIYCELIQMPSNKIFHSVKISFKNVGNLAIYQPYATISVVEYNANNNSETKITEYIKEQFIGDINTTKNQSSLLQNEVIYFSYEQEFSKDIWAVKYIAEVKSKKNIWVNSKIIENFAEIKNKTQVVENNKQSSVQQLAF